MIAAILGVSGPVFWLITGTLVCEAIWAIKQVKK